MAFGEYWDTCEYTDGVLNYNQVRRFRMRFLTSQAESLCPSTHVPDHHAVLSLLLQDAHRQRTVNWVDSTGGTNAAFDFTTKGILQEALGRSELWRLVDAQVGRGRAGRC